MTKKSMYSIIMMLVISALLFTNYSSAVTNNPNIDPQFEDNNKLLSNCTEETSFQSKDDIKEIAEQYELGDPTEIDEIIYVPITSSNELNEEITISPYELGKEEFYIKKKGSYEKKGSLIQSSEFRYPGGTMKVGKKLSRSYNFNAASGVEVSNSIVKAELKASYGFSVSGTDYVEHTQKVKVAKGCKRKVKAYRNLLCYNYELWEDDIKFDDYYGKGVVYRPIGVIFTVGKNTKI